MAQWREPEAEVTTKVPATVTTGVVVGVVAVSALVVATVIITSIAVGPGSQLGRFFQSGGLNNANGNATPCTPSWSCGAWSSCIGGTQTRTCTDANNCGTTLGQPVTSQSCTPPPPGCTPVWTCTSWSACSGGAQTRLCTDSAACGTTAGKPAESQSCTAVPPPPPPPPPPMLLKSWCDLT